jgi:hypothetical protein
MVELNRPTFRKKSPFSPIKDNLGTLATAAVVILCILVSAKMQKRSAPKRIQAQEGVVLDMRPTRSRGTARRGADPIPQKRSSLEVRPIWGNLPGIEKPEAEKEPEPEPEPEPEEPEMPEPPAMQQPDLSDLMKGVRAKGGKARMKAAEFGASTKGGQSAGGSGFTRLTSFGDREAAERKAREEARQAAGPPIGGYENPEAVAKIQRVKQAIERGGAPASMQKYGLDLPQLYQLQAGGYDMEQHVQSDGSLAISDEAAAAMAAHLGIANLGPDKKTTDSAIRPGM